MTPDSVLEYKKRAAEFAAAFVESGMSVGLGTGSTAIWATRQIGARIQGGSLRDLRCVATSKQTELEARSLAIPLFDNGDLPRALDITIDGADEVDPHFNVIKGGGGALLREKIVAQASHRLIIVVDSAKLSPALGTIHPLPVEVLPFGESWQEAFLESLGCKPVLRLSAGGAPLRTDQDNLIFDCPMGAILDPYGLARRIESRAGVVGHGLFLDLVTDVVSAGPDGVAHEQRTILEAL